MQSSFVFLVFEIILSCYVTGQNLQCVFPSIGKYNKIQECKLTVFTQKWWCPTTVNYKRDKKSMTCPQTDTTIGGNSPGRECHFPTIVRGSERTSCLYLKYLPPILPHRLLKTKDIISWCPTTSNFDRDGLWTFCKRKGVSSMYFISVAVVAVIAFSVMVWRIIRRRRQRRRQRRRRPNREAEQENTSDNPIYRDPQSRLDNPLYRDPPQPLRDNPLYRDPQSRLDNPLYRDPPQPPSDDHSVRYPPKSLNDDAPPPPYDVAISQTNSNLNPYPTVNFVSIPNTPKIPE